MNEVLLGSKFILGKQGKRKKPLTLYLSFLFSKELQVLLTPNITDGKWGDRFLRGWLKGGGAKLPGRIGIKMEIAMQKNDQGEFIEY